MTAAQAPPKYTLFHSEQLKKPEIKNDLKKWINGAISSIHLQLLDNTPEPPSSTAISVSAAETVIQATLGAVLVHGQQLSANLENQIALSVTRLPRTALELSRMSSEAAELDQQVKVLHSLMGTSSANNASYLSRLRELKKVQTKLNTCASILLRAKSVEHQIKELDSLRRAPSNASPDLQQDGADGLQDVTRLAESLYDVKSGLEEIRNVEAEFGSHFNFLLQEYEQMIQDQLEEQCLAEFVLHDDRKASNLFQTLYRIGRSSAVLERFYVDVTKKIITQSFITNTESFSSISTHFIRSFWSLLFKEVFFCVRLTARIRESVSDMDKRIKAIDDFGATFIVNFCENLLTMVEAQLNDKLYEMVVRAPTCEDIANFLDSFVAMDGLSMPEHEDLHYPEPEGSAVRKKIQQCIEESVIKVLSEKAIINEFCGKLMHQFNKVARVSEPFTSTSSTDVTCERFSSITQALCKGCDLTLSFFPHRTVHCVIPQWKDTLYRLVSSLEVSIEGTETSLLDSFAFFTKHVRVSIVQCKDVVSEHLATTYARSTPSARENEEWSLQLEELLQSNMWIPLLQHIDAYTFSCRDKIKRWILDPLLKTTEGYASLPLWRLPNDTFADTNQGHLFVTLPIRDLGQAITEIPVKLDDLRLRGVSSTSHKEWIEEVIEEVSATWLDEIVCTAVEDFVQKILDLRVVCSSPSSTLPAVRPDFSSYIMGVWEQLRADVSYLRNVVAAVRDEEVSELENIYEKLQGATPISKTSFTVGEVL